MLTYSSGNHAQAVALAASLLGVPAVIVMPDNAPRVKLAATRAYLAGAPAGSEVVLYDPAVTVREELSGRLAGERGLAVVPPYDHPAVIAGQGTAAAGAVRGSGGARRGVRVLRAGAGCSRVARWRPSRCARRAA